VRAALQFHALAGGVVGDHPDNGFEVRFGAGVTPGVTPEVIRTQFMSLSY